MTKVFTIYNITTILLLISTVAADFSYLVREKKLPECSSLSSAEALSEELLKTCPVYTTKDMEFQCSTATTDKEVKRETALIPSWTVTTDGEGLTSNATLTKTFKFDTFSTAFFL